MTVDFLFYFIRYQNLHLSIALVATPHLRASLSCAVTQVAVSHIVSRAEYDQPQLLLDQGLTQFPRNHVSSFAFYGQEVGSKHSESLKGVDLDRETA